MTGLADRFFPGESAWLAALVILHGVATFVWGTRHGDAASAREGTRIWQSILGDGTLPGGEE